jgi:hypothetical protein
MYFFFFNALLLPVTPSELTVNITNKNQTVSLINDGEINILKQNGLTEISFDFLLPAQNYPFANYYIPQSVFLYQLEQYKKNGTPFQFIVTRMDKQTFIHATNIKCAIEDYEIRESADNGLDIVVSINLKQYRDYSTKKLVSVDGKTTIEKVRG